MRTTQTIALLVGALMTLATIPLVHAGTETISDHYDATLGVRVIHGIPGVNEGLSLSWTPTGDCTGNEVDGIEDWASEETGQPLPDVPDVGCAGPGPNIGGGQLSTEAGDVYSQVVVTAQDDNFDSSYVVACVIIQSGEVFDNVCNDDGDDFRSAACGSVTLDTPGPLFGGENDVVMFISTAVVLPDTLETCFGSSGDLVGVFS